MKKSIAHAFRRLKWFLRWTPQDKDNIRKEVRYLERSYLYTGMSAQTITTTLGRINRLVKRHKNNLPPEFLRDFVQIFATQDEQMQAIKRETDKLDKSR